MPFVICYGIDDTFAFSEVGDGAKISTGQPNSELFVTKAAALQRLVDLGYDAIEPQVSGESAMPLVIDLTAFKTALAHSSVIQEAVVDSLATIPLTAINLVSAISRAERTGDFSEFLQTWTLWVGQITDAEAVMDALVSIAEENGLPPEVLALLSLEANE
jgi:hypothetical protein